ncbi:MAG: hypothetical protein ACLQHK_04810 [Gallionellaceae bacterium]
MHTLGVRTYPAETYFFLADFELHDAAHLAKVLEGKGILVKPLGDTILGTGFMRVSTSQPEDNPRFVHALRTLLT